MTCVDCAEALLVLEDVLEEASVVGRSEVLLLEVVVEVMVEEIVLALEVELDEVVVSALELMLELEAEEVAVDEASGFDAVPLATLAVEVAYTPAPQRKKPRSPWKAWAMRVPGVAPAP